MQRFITSEHRDRLMCRATSQKAIAANEKLHKQICRRLSLEQQQLLPFCTAIRLNFFAVPYASMAPRVNISPYVPRTDDPGHLGNMLYKGLINNRQTSLEHKKITDSDVPAIFLLEGFH